MTTPDSSGPIRGVNLFALLGSYTVDVYINPRIVLVLSGASSCTFLDFYIVDLYINPG